MCAQHIAHTTLSSAFNQIIFGIDIHTEPVQYKLHWCFDHRSAIKSITATSRSFVHLSDCVLEINKHNSICCVKLELAFGIVSTVRSEEKKQKRRIKSDGFFKMPKNKKTRDEMSWEKKKTTKNRADFRMNFNVFIFVSLMLFVVCWNKLQFGPLISGDCLVYLNAVVAQQFHYLFSLLFAPMVGRLVGWLAFACCFYCTLK